MFIWYFSNTLHIFDYIGKLSEQHISVWLFSNPGDNICFLLKFIEARISKWNLCFRRSGLRPNISTLYSREKRKTQKVPKSIVTSMNIKLKKLDSQYVQGSLETKTNHAKECRVSDANQIRINKQKEKEKRSRQITVKS